MYERIHRRIRMPVVVGGAVVGAVIAVAGSTPASAAPATGLPAGVGVVDTNGGSLRVRVGPSTQHAQVGSLAKGDRVTITCQAVGEPIQGRVRTTDRWDRLDDGRFVSDAYVFRDLSAAPPADCGALGPPAPATATGWTVPVSGAVGSGFRTGGRPSHDGVDIPAAKGTPVHAASAGTVITAKCNAASASSCDVDGSLETSGCGWMLEIRHPGGVVTRYCHLVRRPSVGVGDIVDVGQVVGFSGTSGHSSGPHLHFEVHLGAVANRENAVDPVPFMRQHGAPLGASQ